MFAVVLADQLRPWIGPREYPDEELVQRFERAAFFVASNFTAQIKPEDAKYLYLRYKKIRRPLGKDFVKKFVASFLESQNLCCYRPLGSFNPSSSFYCFDSIDWR